MATPIKRTPFGASDGSDIHLQITGLIIVYSVIIFNSIIRLNRGVMFDKILSLCYKISTSPLFLREQGARRSSHRLCFFNLARELVFSLYLGAR
jgi:hypothetical protein